MNTQGGDPELAKRSALSPTVLLRHLWPFGKRPQSPDQDH